MMNPKDIDPKDSNDRYHGYQEWYWYRYSGTLWLRCIYNHGEYIGYYEDHDTKQTMFHIR